MSIATDLRRHLARHSSLLLLVSVLAILALSLAACGGDDGGDTDGEGDEAAGDDGDGEEVEITIAQGVDTEAGDAAEMAATPSMNIGWALYDRLLYRTPDGGIEPALATEWEQIDDTTWEFTLREDAVWHDGEPVTAHDVAFTYNRLIDGDYRQSPNIQPISGAEAVDDYTVRLMTEEPYAPMLARTFFAHIVPQHYVEEVGDEEFNRNPMGSGPFKFVEWSRDEHFIVERFDDYWGGQPEADRIVYRPIAEASSRIAALQTGEADIIVNVPPDLVGEIEDADCCQLDPVPSVRVMFVGMNIHNEPLDDPKVRQALNYAVDKETLMETVMDGMAYPHEGKHLLFGPLINGFKDPEDINDYPYDPERAKTLLAEAGYEDGLTLEFEAPRGRYQNDAELSEAIASMLADVGVETNLKVSEWGTYWPKTVERDQKHLWFLGLGNTLLDAEYYYTLYLSSEGRGYYYTDHMDELIADQQQTMDPEEREDKLHDMHKKFVEEEAPWIFLWDQADIYASRSDIQGWEPRSDERIDVMSLTRE